MIDYSLILTHNYPGKQWSLQDVHDFSSLTWLDPSSKPSQLELDALWESTQITLATKEAERKRSAAYVAEADPLFFKAQRGEATMAEWEAKVAEIKQRYPKV